MDFARRHPPKVLAGLAILTTLALAACGPEEPVAVADAEGTTVGQSSAAKQESWTGTGAYLAGVIAFDQRDMRQAADLLTLALGDDLEQRRAGAEDAGRADERRPDRGRDQAGPSHAGCRHPLHPRQPGADAGAGAQGRLRRGAGAVARAAGRPADAGHRADAAGLAGGRRQGQGCGHRRAEAADRDRRRADAGADADSADHRSRRRQQEGGRRSAGRDRRGCRHSGAAGGVLRHAGAARRRREGRARHGRTLSHPGPGPRRGCRQRHGAPDRAGQAEGPAGQGPQAGHGDRLHPGRHGADGGRLQWRCDVADASRARSRSQARHRGAGAGRPASSGRSPGPGDRRLQPGAGKFDLPPAFAALDRGILSPAGEVRPRPKLCCAS